MNDYTIDTPSALECAKADRAFASVREAYYSARRSPAAQHIWPEIDAAWTVCQRTLRATRRRNWPQIAKEWIEKFAALAATPVNEASSKAFVRGQQAIFDAFPPPPKAA